MRTLAAVLVTMLLGAGFSIPAHAVAVMCPGTVATTDREFTLDTSTAAICLAYGPGNINGNNDVINQLGWITIDKDPDSDVPGIGTNPTALTITGGPNNGTFSFTAPSGYDKFVLALKSGQGQLDPDWAAFELPAGVTSGSWSISSQGFSHANLYGMEGLPNQGLPEPGTLLLLGAAFAALGLRRRLRSA